MMSDTTAEAAAAKRQEPCLEISMESVPSRIQGDGGKEIPFSRARLSMRNTCPSAVVGIVPHATLAREGGSVHDGSEALSRARTTESIPPGETVTWDVYDVLLTSHPGVASMIHLWGYKAVLNWWFDVTAWAEYRDSDAATPPNAPISKWRLCWSPAKPPADGVDLSIVVVGD